jgi:hypothetical protein
MSKKRSHEKQNGPKMEPRGATNRIGARKMTQDSARQRQRAAQEAYPVLSRKAGASKWMPKSIKIHENSIKKQILVQSFF